MLWPKSSDSHCLNSRRHRRKISVAQSFGLPMPAPKLALQIATIRMRRASGFAPRPSALLAPRPATARRKFAVRAADPGSFRLGSKSTDAPDCLLWTGLWPVVRRLPTLALCREIPRNCLYDGLTMMIYPFFTLISRARFLLSGAPFADISWPSYGFCGLPARKPCCRLWRPGDNRSDPERSA